VNWGRARSGQGGAMLGQLGQAGKGERESVVPLASGERSDTGGKDTLYPCTFSLPHTGARIELARLKGSHALCPCPCHSRALTAHLLATLYCGLLSTAPTCSVCRLGVDWGGIGRGEWVFGLGRAIITFPNSPY